MTPIPTFLRVRDELLAFFGEALELTSSAAA